MSLSRTFTPWFWLLLTALTGVFLVAGLLVLEWRGMDHSASPAANADIHSLPRTMEEGNKPSMTLPVSAVSNIVRPNPSPVSTASSGTATAPQGVSPTTVPAEIPTVYANPEVLGEVSPYHDEMYTRVMNRFASKMQGVTAPPDSPEYRRKFEEASKDADNALRALMGHDAYIRLKAAVEKGQTVQ
jgi:hypothetical protein